MPGDLGHEGSAELVTVVFRELPKNKRGLVKEVMDIYLVSYNAGLSAEGFKETRAGVMKIKWPDGKKSLMSEV